MSESHIAEGLSKLPVTHMVSTSFICFTLLRWLYGITEGKKCAVKAETAKHFKGVCPRPGGSGLKFITEKAEAWLDHRASSG